MLATAQESADAYGAIQGRISAVLTTLDAEHLMRQVPACPAWSVADLVAHLAGNARDLATGNLDGVASDAWTDAQVQRGRSRPLMDLLEEWSADTETVQTMLPHAPPGPAAQLVFDTCTHEQDLHGALGTVGDREHQQLAVALSFMTSTLDGLVRGLGLPTLELCTEYDQWVLGDGDPQVCLQGTRYDLLRALGGRRTREELTALVTHGSFEPFELIFTPPSPLQLPTASLGE